jgi:hypothetical protein
MDYYYHVLELNPGASDIEIKKAYRRLARKYHPDVNPAPDAEDRFIEITEAYESLLEKKPYSAQFVFEHEEPVFDREEQRRERARQYARRRYEEFQQMTTEFREAWYYGPLKFIRYGIIYLLYVVALGMLLSPFLAWFITRNSIVTFGFGFLAIISSQVYVLARTIYNGTKAYFGE